jgi:hypothetical protein
MAEWSIAVVLKTTERKLRGFESLSLRFFTCLVFLLSGNPVLCCLRLTTQSILMGRFVLCCRGIYGQFEMFLTPTAPCQWIAACRSRFLHWRLFRQA